MVLKGREGNRFINKAPSKSSAGNNGVTKCIIYEVLTSEIHLVSAVAEKEMWKKKNVGKRWKTAEGIFLSKEEKSEKLGQF